jgi:1,4-dihydroxy-2-naphthoyl-CoA synthase
LVSALTLFCFHYIAKNCENPLTLNQTPASSVHDDISRTDVDGVITLTFTRDRKLNAVSDDMLDVMREAVRDLGDSESIRALIITAEGRYFTAGKDIGQMGTHSSSGVALRRNYRRLHELFDELERIEKPVILAAQGPCLGIGWRWRHLVIFGLPRKAQYSDCQRFRTLPCCRAQVESADLRVS